MDAQAIQSGLDRVEDWLQRKQPFALLLIAACEPLFFGDAAMLRMVAQRVEDAGDTLHRSLLGVAVVVPEAITDAARQSLARLPLDMPLEIFEKGLHAAEWLCRSVLKPAGLAIDSL
ncbi:hypothetical protein [Rhizobium sp. P44RR-XXIV]|uniref:hypothetical protein n=1 Tax=Rhizobium sp. P44RR-XXIV TaxID=1921145 RepID=UPI0010AA24A6|nr:hypothetical protein [Rhizobium sp. P44RR-XXIV]TIX87413.1 hypothetical protein BSK43_031435 [Rhizobium sp. P44RR-XXIV]